MRDGIYQVTHKGICAGFVIRNGNAVYCAPVLRKKLTWWVTIAKYIGEEEDEVQRNPPPPVRGDPTGA